MRRHSARLLVLALLLPLVGDVPSTRSTDGGDRATHLTPRPRPLDFSVYMPPYYDDGRVYPVLVGLFDHPSQHEEFLTQWRQVYGSEFPFYYVIPRLGGRDLSEVEVSLSSLTAGDVPLTHAGLPALREGLTGMLERMGRSYRINEAYLVTAWGMEPLEVPSLVLDHWTGRRF